MLQSVVNRVTAIPGNMPGAVQDRENLSREVSPRKYLRENLSRELPTSGKTCPGNYFTVNPLPGEVSRRYFPRDTSRERFSESRTAQGMFPGIAVTQKSWLLLFLFDWKWAILSDDLSDNYWNLTMKPRPKTDYLKMTEMNQCFTNKIMIMQLAFLRLEQRKTVLNFFFNRESASPNLEWDNLLRDTMAALNRWDVQSHIMWVYKSWVGLRSR